MVTQGLKRLVMGSVLFLAVSFFMPAGQSYAQLGGGTPLGTAFTYQGRLTDTGGLATGPYDFMVNLLDGEDPSTALVIGTQTLEGVSVNDGLFTLTLDFGLAFDGKARWLQISVAREGGAFTELTPTQPLHASPYALTAIEVPDGSITSAKIAMDSVHSGHLQTTGISAGLYGSSTQVPQLFIGIDGRIGSATPQAINITGDNIVDGSVSSADLNTTGISSGLYGSSTHVPQLFIGTDGRIGSATPQAINITGDYIVNSTITGDDIADNSISSADLNTTGVASGMYGTATKIPRIFVGTDGRIGSVSEVEITSGSSDFDWDWISGSGLSGSIYHTGTVSVGTSAVPMMGKMLLSDSGNEADLMIQDTSPTLFLNKTAAYGNAGIAFMNQNIPVGFIYHSGSDDNVHLSGRSSGESSIVLSTSGRVGVNAVPIDATLDISGLSTSTEPVVDVQTTYSGTSDVSGIRVTSEPSAGYGYGIQVMAGSRGIWSSANGGPRNTSIYGGYFTASGTAGQHYGVYAQASGAGSLNTGFESSVTGATGNRGGNFEVYGTASTNTGIRATVEGGTLNRGGYFITSGSASSNYGIEASASGASTNYGGSFSVSGSATNNYGLNVTAGGATNNRGGNFLVDSAGTQNYGIQATVGGATTNYGAFFSAAGTATTNTAVRGSAVGGTTNNGGYFTAGGAGTVNYGIYVTASGAMDNWAGYFHQGNIYAGGNVAIGTEQIATGYRLSVHGKIMCEELQVQNQVDWPDYVFHEDYEVMPLDQLASEISKNGHLPGMPSAREVAENGIHIGEMQAKLLEKIEQLTLYVIKQDRENEELRQRIDQLQARINEKQ